MYFKNFDGVFTAIEQGLCQYGILPIENSTAGSVKKVYDLMIRHNFSIVRTFRLKVDHNLLANPDADLAGIKEIYSHEQAINQCSDFLKSMTGVQIIPVENTAVAAEMVAKSGGMDVAAIILAASLGIGFILAIYKEYDVIEFDLEKRIMRLERH